MIGINKNLALFSALVLLIGTLLAFILQKFSPLISHASYYCQSLIKSLSISIPYYLGIIPFIAVFVLFLIAIVRFSIVYIKVQFLRKRLTKSLRSKTSFNKLVEKLNLTDKTYLIENEKPFAFCLGIRSPKIYVSTNLINLITIRELEAVLRHEQYHLNNRDTLTILIASIGESLLPFFPILSDLLHNYRIEREIKADAEAIQGLGDEKPLISVLKKLLASPPVAMATASAIADRDTLEPRIYTIIKKDLRFKQFRAKHILISVVSVFVMSIITLAPVQAVEVHHIGEDVMMVCPQNDVCLNACKQEYSVDKKNFSEDVVYTSIN